MRFAAARSEWTEATIIVRTRGKDVGGVAVVVEAVGGVGAVEGTGVVRAVGHSSSVRIGKREKISVLLNFFWSLKNRHSVTHMLYSCRNSHWSPFLHSPRSQCLHTRLLSECVIWCLSGQSGPSGQ